MDEHYLKYKSFVHNSQKTLGNNALLPVCENSFSRQYSPRSSSSTPTQHEGKSTRLIETTGSCSSRKKRRERWDQRQTKVLVHMWKELSQEHEHTYGTGALLRIKDAVDRAGPVKSIKQVKDKIRNLKDAYKKAREHNQRPGTRPIYSPYYNVFDEMFGAHDTVKVEILSDDQVEFGSPEARHDDTREIVERDVSEFPTDNLAEGAQSNHAEEEEESDVELIDLFQTNNETVKRQNNRLPFQEQILQLLRDQLEQQNALEQKRYQLIMDLFEQQRKAYAEERERDRQFFLQLGSLLSGNYKSDK